MADTTHRILALDLGTRRIGLALSDELGITAQPLPTLERRTLRSDLATLKRLAKRKAVSEVVVGLPLRLSGEAGTQAAKAEEFAELLRTELELPVAVFDERLTSAEANRMLDEAGLDRLQRKGKVDQMAAVMILQGYMQARSAQRGAPSK
jgi:putative Holliday junction resolvase